MGNDGAGNQAVKDGVGDGAKEASRAEELVVGSGDGEVTLMYEMYDEKFPIKVH